MLAMPSPGMPWKTVKIPGKYGRGLAREMACGGGRSALVLLALVLLAWAMQLALVLALAIPAWFSFAVIVAALLLALLQLPWPLLGSPCGRGGGVNPPLLRRRRCSSPTRPDLRLDCPPPTLLLSLSVKSAPGAKADDAEDDDDDDENDDMLIYCDGSWDL